MSLLEWKVTATNETAPVIVATSLALGMPRASSSMAAGLWTGTQRMAFQSTVRLTRSNICDLKGEPETDNRWR